ncbi:hypothetical protein GCM10023259_094750 [Thermocatellispora tengchongensis]
MGTAPEDFECAKCHRAAARVFSAPHLARMPSGLAAALAREEQSREAPQVVTEVPGRRRERPPHPALGRLPRP